MIARTALVVVAALAFAGGAAQAQSYPARPIRIVVPFSPGGPTDMISRIIGQKMQSILGQSIIVENKLGAATLVIAQAINKNLGYDPAIAFVPIAPIATSSNVLVVNPALPVKTVAELVAYAKANPGRLSFSSPGVGTPGHLIAEWFNAKAGLDLVHIPYKGGGVSVQDVVSGQVQLTFENPATALPVIEAGSVRALAVTSETRNPRLPNVPTMVESGIKDFVTVSFFGLVARNGTPADIVAKLSGAVNESLKAPGVESALGKLSLDIRTGSPSEFAEFLGKEREKWGSIVGLAHIQVE